MRNPFRVGGFERRLIVFFLLLSVLPTLLIAFFSTRYFMRSVELVSNPAVEQSFTNSMEIARDFAAKLEEDARCAAVRLADEYARAGRPQAGKGLETILRKVSAETHADFTALYTLEASTDGPSGSPSSGSFWKIKTSYPEAFARIEPEIKLDAATQAAGPTTTARIPFADQDVIASGVAIDNSLFVAGYALGKGLTEKMRRTGDDLNRYHAVGLYVSVLRRYIVIVTGVLLVILAVSSTIVSRLLARRISQPITVLADATERIAKGDLEHRVTVTARDEVQSLVTGFNKMTEELQENKKNLISMAKREAQIARDFEIARQVQEGLFPTALPLVRGWEFAAICRAAKVVGGDYYDIFEISPGKVLFAQGDVSGKGVGASITMASVHAIIRSWGGAIQANLENLKDDPARLVAELNRYLVSSRTPEMFVTAFLGLLDCQTSELWYVNCGHPPAVILRSGDTRPEALTVGGMVLGVSERAPYSTGTCRIESGDALVLVSDGVTEATNPKGDLYGESMQAKMLASSRGLSALDAMQQLLSSVDGFMAGAEQTDDISILVIGRTT